MFCPQHHYNNTTASYNTSYSHIIAEKNKLRLNDSDFKLSQYIFSNKKINKVLDISPAPTHIIILAIHCYSYYLIISVDILFTLSAF